MSYLDQALVIVTAAKDGKPAALPFTYADGILAIGEHRIGIRAVAEHSSTEKDSFFLGARFELILDGSLVPQLNYWTVAVGKSKQDIVKTVVQQWYMAFGRTVFDAIANRPTPLSWGRYRIYPGYTGIRGTAPDGWKDWGGDNMHNKIIPAITPFLDDVDPFHASDIMVTAKQNGDISGQCLLDAKQSKEIFSVLKELPWPKTQSTYMLKQSYVFARNDVN